MATIKLSNISKKFDKQVLFRVSLKVRKNELVGIIGSNGSGKTTLLRIIAGLEKPDEGEVFIGKEKVFSKEKFVPPEKRNVGFVFQDLALWPHMSVKEHLEFVLESKGIKEKWKIKEILETVNLIEYENSYPNQLSGGEKQRLAIGRALAQDSKILLLDEPFSNLDPILKKTLRKMIKNLQKEFKVAILYVTQDPREVSEIADKIIIMNEGKIIQTGEFKKVKKNPKNDFVRNILSD